MSRKVKKVSEQQKNRMKRLIANILEREYGNPFHDSVAEMIVEVILPDTAYPKMQYNSSEESVKE